MCEHHARREPFLLRKLMMKIYSRWIDDTLDFYLFMGRTGKLPVVGPVVRFFAGQYGKYFHGGRAATVEECLALVSRADSVSIMDCACRTRSGNCDNPLKACIVINSGAKVFRSEKKQEPISPEEAKEIIHRSYSRGLIRSVEHCVVPHVYAICNCCTCCCVPYRLRTEYGVSGAVENGYLVPVLDAEKCTACGKCRETCPQQAIDPVMGVLSERSCLGCGLCVGACSQGALRMVKRLKENNPTYPGVFRRALIYAAFFGVILPLAVIHKNLKVV